MELSPRQKAVLAAVTKAYIKTGEPIGSKALMSLLKNAPSSATLRNEMSELCELGLLTQPHTSAGRVPTSMGFKFYVDTLMTADKISESSKAFIDKGLENIHAEPEKIPEIAGKLLSDLTGLPVLTCLLTTKNPKIRKVELIPIARNSVMLLLITSDGRALSKISRTAKEFNSQLEDKLKKIITERINGKYTDELIPGFIQGVIAEAGSDALVLTPLLSSVFEMAQSIESSDVNLVGEASLYNICKDDDAARRIISLVKLQEPIISMLSGIEENVGVIFGNETGIRELDTDTVIAAKYSVNDKFKGAIGVIGPNRISYDQIIPSVEYISLRLSDIMAKAGKDMEE